MKSAVRSDRRGAPKPPINENIRAKELRLIGADGKQVGIVSIREALSLALEAKLDLVEITPDANPPVAKIMDYGKHLYEKKKQAHAAKKNQKQVEIKEIKLKPGTEEHDYQVKLRAITKFLEEGNKVKIALRFRGREMAHQDIGVKALQRIEQDVSIIGGVELQPKLEGRQLVMIVAPKKKR